MPDLWMPGAKRYYGVGRALNGGGARYANWHSTENDPTATADTLANYLISKHYEPHFVWNPWTGELAQLLPVNVGGSVLKSGNVSGSVNIGIEAIGRAGVVGMRPFYDSPMKGFGPLLDFIRSWGVPNVWPAGAPLAYPASAGYGNPQRAKWGPSGHYGHSQWPSNDHGDPGLTKTELWGAPLSTTGRFDGYGTMAQGSLGQHVIALQNALNITLGHESASDPARLVPDGDFGARTTAAVKAFQTKYKLTADGVVGDATWTKLGKVLDQMKR